MPKTEPIDQGDTVATVPKSLRDKLIYEVPLRHEIVLAGMPEPETEIYFARHLGREWRFDIGWTDRKLAVESEGGTFKFGRHSRGASFDEDAIKYNVAASIGWTVLRFGPKQLAKKRLNLTVAFIKIVYDSLTYVASPFYDYRYNPDLTTVRVARWLIEHYPTKTQAGTSKRRRKAVAK